MTPEEFKSKFKVGDVIRNKTEKNIAPFLTITFIGETSFVCIDDYKIERLFIQSHDWIKVEPEKKPSEEINYIFHEIHQTPQDNDQWCINKFKAIHQWLDENWPKVVKK